MVEEIKKKRGRKPKDQTNKTQNPYETTAKKRDRKPKVTFSFDNQKKEEEIDNEKNIILKLKLPCAEDDILANGQGNKLDDNNNFVCAYNECNMSNFSTLNVVDTLDIGDPEHKPHDNIKKIGNNKVIELLKEFNEKAKVGEWPSSTSIACFWCCNKFTGPPLGLPCKYYNNIFYVTGCFCSLECASAYNVMQMRDNQVEERNNLLNYLSTQLEYADVVKAAPPREMLQMFGGNMTIDEFRNTNQDKFIHINFPPMTVLVSQFEEINDSDISFNSKYIPLDNDRINKYKEKIKLQRNNPINISQNTLENVMHFSVT